ncbi:MAG: hypothetical protein N2114_06685, partial [Candidatus Goldbacteria bacterium]|nr:hypothetical protein [Candidatus Goldiibacteriota bacterium]
NKAKTFHLFFNFARKNSYKGFKSPSDILSEYNLSSDIAFIQPIIIDRLYRHNFSSEDNYLNYYVHVLPDYKILTISYKTFSVN